MEVDLLGRVTTLVEPSGAITFTVYNDANHETRTYRGWNASTHLPTGPVEVSRDDLAGGYSESLTFSWTAAGGLPLEENRPSGAESLSSANAIIQSLSRTLKNSARVPGRVPWTQYLTIDGVPDTMKEPGSPRKVRLGAF